MNASSEGTEIQHVECPPAKDPAVRWFILVAMMLGYSFWCISDRRPLPKAWVMDHVNDAAGYLFNNWGPVVLIPIGIIALVLGIRHLTRKLIANAQGLGYAGKKPILWNQFTRLDTARLQGKGILDLYYGQGQKLTLDSWKLQNFRELVALVEKMLPQDVQKV